MRSRLRSRLESRLSSFGYIGAPATATTLLARTIYPDATGKLILPDEDRTTTLYAKNSDGVYEAFGSGVPAVVGARKVGSDYYATDAMDDPLDPLPYVLTCPAATNSCAYSQDISQTGWTNQGCVLTQDQTDIFGNANTAWTVEDNNGAGFEGVFYTVSVASNTSPQSICIRVKKAVSPSTYPGFWITVGSSHYAITIDHENGTITDEDGAVTGNGGPDSSSISDDGTHWKVTITQANASQTSITFRLYASVNTDASGTWANSTTGSCVIDQAEIFLNTAHAVAHALPPIPTSGSAATINLTEVHNEDAPTENFVIKFHWTPEYDDQGTVFLVGNYTDANNGWGVLHDGTNIIFRNRVSGSNNDATKALNYVVGTEYEITARHSTDNGLDIWVDDTKGTNDSTTTAVTSAAVTYLGQNGNDANIGINGVRDFRRWSIPAGLSDAPTVALAA